MQYKHFIGVDISKPHLDFHLNSIEHGSSYLGKCTNTPKHLSIFIRKLIKSKKMLIETVLVCAENTGIYGNHLKEVCKQLNFPLWIEHPRTIKMSSGFNRGKSDPVDAGRIADYAKRYSDKVELVAEVSEVQKELSALSHARESIITSIKRFEVQIKEAEKFDKISAGILKKSYQNTIKAATKDLQRINKEIDAKIKGNEDIKQTIELATSIKGVGRETALALTLKTDNFQRFENAKQLACYVGVAPFVCESGISIKGRARVSHAARKDLKRLLHLAAISSIRFNDELKTYYVRKVKEGKNKMSAINAVRNKLLQRIFAVVKRGTPYVEWTKEKISESQEIFNSPIAS